MTSLDLAPTKLSLQNLTAEGGDPDKIVVTGKTVINALLEAVTWDVQFADDRLSQIVDAGQQVVLVTTHRRENLSTMESVGKAMRRLAERYPRVAFVLPAHLNPKVRAAVLPQIDGIDNVLVESLIVV